MRLVHTYRMTVATSWYDATERGAKSYEQHFTVTRPGKIRTVRRTLSKRGFEYFQGSIYRRFKKWTPKWKIKIRFEREELAQKRENAIRVEGSSMLYRGKRWWAYPLPHRVLSYGKRRRRRRRHDRR